MGWGGSLGEEPGHEGEESEVGVDDEEQKVKCNLYLVELEGSTGCRVLFGGSGYAVFFAHDMQVYYNINIDQQSETQRQNQNQNCRTQDWDPSSLA